MLLVDGNDLVVLQTEHCNQFMKVMFGQLCQFVLCKAPKRQHDRWQLLNFEFGMLTHKQQNLYADAANCRQLFQVPAEQLRQV